MHLCTLDPPSSSMCRRQLVHVSCCRWSQPCRSFCSQRWQRTVFLPILPSRTWSEGDGKQEVVRARERNSPVAAAGLSLPFRLGNARSLPDLPTADLTSFCARHEQHGTQESWAAAIACVRTNIPRSLPREGMARSTSNHRQDLTMCTPPQPVLAGTCITRGMKQNVIDIGVTGLTSSKMAQ